MTISRVSRLLVPAVALLLALASTAAAEDVLYIVDDKVGIGTSTPGDKLDVQGDGVTLNVEDTSTTEAARILFRLTNNGRINFNMYNTASGENWQFSNSATGFQINETVSSNVEARVTTAGDLYLEGQVYASSSRELKEAIVPLDGADVLAKVAALPVPRWSYRGSEAAHVGPMAEDFYAAFAVGQDDKTLSPSDTAGVALVAIQQLKTEVDGKDAEIARLRSQLDEQDARYAALEARLARLEAAAPAGR